MHAPFDDIALHAHLIGRQGSWRDLNTPVLVIDLDALDRNVGVMAAFAARHQLKLRPHAKTHKSAEIARRQILAGAVGVCCAKLGEAEVLADAGLTGLHLTSPVTSPPAIARLASLHARAPDLMVVTDHPSNVPLLAAAVSGPAPLNVIIDIDPGLHRTGVTSPEAAVALAKAIGAESKLRFAGVQLYCGSEQHIAAFTDRAAAMQTKAELLDRTLEALRRAGTPAEIVTGGGTGTHQIDATLGLFTELQVGSYVFMDDQYADCELTAAGGRPFSPALFVDARVISINTPGLATVDAGLKAFATVAGPPRLVAGAPDGARYAFMGDEQGVILFGSGPPLGLAEMVRLSPPHCDPTVNLYDTYHVVRGETLVDLWPVSARGRSR